MKIFFSFLFIFLSSPIFANDISDFQIEGISIGDTLLRYMSEEEILNEKKENINLYKDLGDPIFYEVYIFDKFINYEYLSFFIKSNDDNYIIQAIYGVTLYEENIRDCHNKINELSVKLDRMFNNTNKVSENIPLYWDDSGRSSMKRVTYKFKNQDIIALECYDWDKTYQRSTGGHPDIFSMSVNTRELFDWIN